MNAILDASHSVSAALPDPAAALLQTIAEVLDIRHVFPRVSTIVKAVVPHDALELVFYDRQGHVTLEASSADDLPGYAGSGTGDNQAFSIVSNLGWIRRPQAPSDSPDVIDALVEAGYRSVLSVRRDANSQVMRLVFLSKQTHAYTADDVPSAQHVADYVAVAVAHEQLAAAERDRAEARAQSERVSARVRALAESGEVLPATAG